MRNPKVSVIMSTYNESENELRQAIESILNQSFTEFEFIIILDNPDNSVIASVVAEYACSDERIVLICNEANIGLARSLNTAIDFAKGKYIARMDADDISIDIRLERETEYLDAHPQCQMVCSNCIQMTEDGREIGVNTRVPKSDAALMKSIKYTHLIFHPTVMMRTESLQQLGKYNNYQTTQDYDLWLRMNKNGYQMHYIYEPLLKYRYRPNSIGNKKRYIQFLSGQYARKLYYSGTKFNETEYKEYIELKKNKKKYMKGVQLYYAGIKDKSFKKLIKAILLNGDCCKEVWNICVSRRYTKRLSEYSIDGLLE